MSRQHATQEKISLWQAGFRYDDEIVGKSGQEWFGLFEKDRGFELRRVKVTVNDSSNGLQTKFVEINQPGRPIILVRGGNRFTEGAIHTCFYGSQFVAPTQELALKLSSKWSYIFIGTGTQDGEYFRNYSLSIFHNQVKHQVLSLRVVHPEGAYPRIKWVGDLDRDGKPDMLIDFGRANGSRLALFLSSYAQSGEFFKQVALFETTGC
jgi:hypothetical protein